MIYVENKAEESSPPAAFRSVVERFYISSTCDGPETKEIVATVSPKELYVFGPYAKRYVEMLDGLVPQIHALFPNDQPTLF